MFISAYFVISALLNKKINLKS